MSMSYKPSSTRNFSLKLKLSDRIVEYFRRFGMIFFFASPFKYCNIHRNTLYRRTSRRMKSEWRRKLKGFSYALKVTRWAGNLYMHFTMQASGKLGIHQSFAR